MKKYLLLIGLIIISMTSFVATVRQSKSEKKIINSSIKEYAFILFYVYRYENSFEVDGPSYVTSIFCFNQDDFKDSYYSSTIGHEKVLVKWARDASINNSGNTNIADCKYFFFSTDDIDIKSLDDITTKRSNEISEANRNYAPVSVVYLPSCYEKEKQ